MKNCNQQSPKLLLKTNNKLIMSHVDIDFTSYIIYSFFGKCINTWATPKNNKDAILLQKQFHWDAQDFNIDKVQRCINNKICDTRVNQMLAMIDSACKKSN